MENLPCRVLALDFETSGLVAKYDQITEIGACVFDNGEPVGEPFQSRVRLSPTQKISLEALSVQAEAGPEDWKGIGRALKTLYDAPDMASVVQSFADWAQDNNVRGLPVVAHNASFDYGFYSERMGAFKSVCSGAILSPVWICTMALMRHVFPDAKKTNLDTALCALGLPAREEALGHSALQDAILTGRVYFGLRRLLEEAA